LRHWWVPKTRLGRCLSAHPAAPQPLRIVTSAQGFRHGATENGSLNEGHIPNFRRTCTCENGLQIPERGIGGRRETAACVSSSPARNPYRDASQFSPPLRSACSHLLGAVCGNSPSVNFTALGAGFVLAALDPYVPAPAAAATACPLAIIACSYST
jgi:hypothetical protein